MRNFLKSAALSVLIGLGAIAAAPSAASAGDGALYLGIGDGSARFSIQVGQRDRYYHRPARHVRHCTPGQAVHKAQRMGVRNARVVREGRNVIRVRGRAYGHGRVTVVFARAPHCPVIRSRG